MSAFPPNADILKAIAKLSLMTQSGHSLDDAVRNAVILANCFNGTLKGFKVLWCKRGESTAPKTPSLWLLS
jgi:hypothetical protein